MLIKLAVSGYRSLRDIVLPLDRLNLITGANGAGKSSLYKAIGLLAAAAFSKRARSASCSKSSWAKP